MNVNRHDRLQNLKRNTVALSDALYVDRDDIHILGPLNRVLPSVLGIHRRLRGVNVSSRAAPRLLPTFFRKGSAPRCPRHWR
jgi:hypothetical protein